MYFGSKLSKSRSRFSLQHSCHPRSISGRKTDEIETERRAKVKKGLYLIAIFKTIGICGLMSVASYAQEPRLTEVNGQVGIVSGIGTHGSFGSGVGVALTSRVLG